eukprot:6193519-Pleurochrysis_carterae.AAC.1
MSCMTWTKTDIFSARTTCESPIHSTHPVIVYSSYARQSSEVNRRFVYTCDRHRLDIVGSEETKVDLTHTEGKPSFARVSDHRYKS